MCVCVCVWVWPEGSLLNSYDTKVLKRGLFFLFHCSNYRWSVPYNAVVFGVTRPGIKTQSPKPLANTLTIIPITDFVIFSHISHLQGEDRYVRVNEEIGMSQSYEKIPAPRKKTKKLTTWCLLFISYYFHDIRDGTKKIKKRNDKLVKQAIFFPAPSPD